MPEALVFTTNNVRTLAEMKAWQAGADEEALDPGMPIIDPHHHLREGAAGRYHLPELAADLAGGHDIRATVFIDSQTHYRPDGPPLLRPVGETEFVVKSLADAPPFAACTPCAAIVGTLDFLHGASIRDGLLAHQAAADGRFRGVRDPLAWDDSGIDYGPRRPARDRMTDPRFRAAFAELAPLDLTFDAWLFHHQLPMLTDLARSFPETTIVLDHVGAPLGAGLRGSRRTDVFDAWRVALVELSSCPNVVVKLGGLGMLYFGFDFHRRERPPASAGLAAAWQPYVDICIDAFGPRRCMFESNFPVDKQTCSYTTLWNAFKRIAARYSQEEQRAMFFDTANRVYRLGLDPRSRQIGKAAAS